MTASEELDGSCARTPLVAWRDSRQCLLVILLGSAAVDGKRDSYSKTIESAIVVCHRSREGHVLSQSNISAGRMASMSCFWRAIKRVGRQPVGWSIQLCNPQTGKGASR